MAKGKKEILKFSQAQQQRMFLEEPLNEKTILFVDSTNCPASGDMRAILEYCLSESAFDDYSLIWSAGSINEVAVLPKEELRNGRIKLVAANANGFRKALTLSKVIITTQMMPHYFVKRDRQIVVYLPCEDVYRNRRVVMRSFIRAATPQMDITDVVASPHEAFLASLLSLRSPACVRQIKAIRCCHPRQLAGDSGERGPAVVFAFSESRFKEYWLEKPDALYNWANEHALRLRVLPSDMAMFVPGSAIGWLNEAYVGSAIKIAQYAEGLYPYLRNAKVVVTDNIQNVCIAQSANVPSVFITGAVEAQRISNPYYYPFFKAPCIPVKSLDEAIVKARDYTQVDVEAEDVPGSLESCSMIMGEVFDLCRRNNDDAGMAKEEATTNLLCLKWLDNDEFRTLAKNDLNSIAETTLLMADQGCVIASEEYDSFSRACITYRTGYHLGSPEERLAINDDYGALKEELACTPGNFIELEWRRLLGEVWFDTIFAPKQGDGFWSLMLSFAPANHVIFYDSLSELEQFGN